MVICVTMRKIKSGNINASKYEPLKEFRLIFPKYDLTRPLKRFYRILFRVIDPDAIANRIFASSDLDHDGTISFK